MFDMTCLDSYGEVVTYLTQWDIDQSLIIKNTGLTSSPVFHFYNQNSKEAYVVASTLESGVITVHIPNTLLQESLPINVCLYAYSTLTSGKTLATVKIPVRPRPKPSDYKYVENINVVSMEQVKKDLLSELGNDYVAQGQFASTTQAGIVKLYSRIGTTNASGLFVNSDGSMCVYTDPNYGTNRSGDGKVVTSPATADEIEAGTQAYKPITPATFKNYKEKIATTEEHIANTSNPHSVTKEHVGLGNVDNAKQATKTEFDEHREATTLDHPDGCVTVDKLANMAVSTIKIDTSAVTTTKLANKAVTTAKLADSAVNQSKIADGAVGFKQLDTDLTTYSTTPVQVGTWIDGVPVWRVAFDNVPLTPEETAENGKYWHNADSLVNAKNYNYVQFLNAVAIVGTDPKCSIDSNMMSFDEDCYFSFDFSFGYRIPYKSTNLLLSGYVEFITPESNLKTT